MEDPTLKKSNASINWERNWQIETIKHGINAQVKITPMVQEPSKMFLTHTMSKTLILTWKMKMTKISLKR